MNDILGNTDFFNRLAEEYDLMIPFAKAVDRKKNLFKDIINPYMKYAADIGSGTGTDSIALTSIGLKVTAFDPSIRMINIARDNAKKEGTEVDFYNYPIDLIPGEFANKFDIAIALGNTFANVERDKFIISIKKCFNILKQGGTLLLQILNYEKVVAEKRRIINITEKRGSYFVRFYDFVDNELIFNILTFKLENPSQYRLISTRLFPYSKFDLEGGLKEAGFTSIEFFSDFNLSTFDNQQSKDLIIRAISI
jgi:SAM-dependent methyltransferase